MGTSGAHCTGAKFYTICVKLGTSSLDALGGWALGGAQWTGAKLVPVHWLLWLGEHLGWPMDCCQVLHNLCKT